MAERDRSRMADLGWVGAGLVFLVLAAYVHLWIARDTLQKRYTVQALYQQRQDLLQTLEQLEAHYRELTALARVDRLAQGYLRLYVPQPSQVLNTSSGASGTLGPASPASRP